VTLASDVCSSSWQGGGCEWCVRSLLRFWYFWRSLDWVERAALTLLALMSANSVVIAFHRLYRYNIARKQSRAFLRDSTNALRDGRFDEVVLIAARNTRSSVASMVVAGLDAFASVPLQFTDIEAIAAAERAFQRTGTMLIAELGLGLGTLRTIATCAPFVGLAGTWFEILNAFRGYIGARSSFIARTASDISNALVMTAVGLLVGILAVWFHNYLWRRIEVLQTEMWEAETDTIQHLKSDRQRHRQHEPMAVTRTDSCFVMAKPSSREVPYDRQRALLLSILLCGIYLVLMFTLSRC
jgi:biopolymer transport protein ExbB/TolQ